MTCPVCGDTVRGHATVTEGGRRISAFACPTCGRFSCDDAVLARLTAADEPTLIAVSLWIQLRNEDRSAGTALRPEDLPPCV